MRVRKPLNVRAVFRYARPSAANINAMRGLGGNGPLVGTGIVLGAFELVRPLGKGGMAEVWLAFHRAQGTHVAIKVLTGAHAREPAFVRAVKNEIESVARLRHPGIILVFDTGAVDAAAQDISSMRFVEGSPFFVMELASHGALSPRRLPLPWGTARMLLLSLLDALSHAHARGVIHRDIKPGNVLLCAPEDPRPGLKLSDFGIAAPLIDGVDNSDDQSQLSGTPRYMAPEQFQARWRDFGPWTDLYALGCIAYQLLTGHTPFGGDALRLAIAHCHDVPEPPKLKGYPAGFDGWVLRLLEKEPGRRFQCAADAAWALLKLQPPQPDEDLTVVAGWEQALRSLRPRGPRGQPLSTHSGDSEPASGDDVTLAARGEDVSGDAPQALHAPSATAEAPQPDDSEISTRTVMQRPRRSQLPPEFQHTAAPAAQADATLSGSSVFTRVRVRRRGALASQSSEAPATDQLAHTALRRAARRDDDALFPPIRPKDPTGPTRTVQLASNIDGPAQRSNSAEAGVVGVVETTFAPNVPWTELAALSPYESEPTLTARADPHKRPDAGSRRGAESALLAPRLPPPLPATWRRLEPLVPSTHLLGAGLGLYGLRQIPLVDRDYERDQVWDALRDVHQGRGARVVVVRGPAGIGKTRLCEWLLERSAEVGAAVALRAGHGAGGGALSGLSGMVAIHARALGLQAGDLVARLRHVVVEQGLAEREEALALASLLEPGIAPPAPPLAARVAASISDGGEQRVRLHSDRERHAVVLRYLARAAADRPVVAWLDDVQWGADAIRFARHVIDDDANSQIPVLLLLSATNELLGERPIEAQLLDDLLQHASGRVIDINVPSLPAADHKALVTELLGLEERLAEMVAERTAGNPLFAVTLVGDFIARGVLELTPHGFALKPGERAVLPDDLFGVWAQRIDRQLKHLPATSRLAIELGSVLGTAGDDGEWAAICTAGGVDLSPALIDELLKARLLVDDDGGVRFPHAMLRESMLRTAAEAGRLQSHHRIAASMLITHYAPGHRGIGERIARHLVASGDLAGALPHLLAAAIAAGRSASYGDAHALLAERDALLDRLKLSDGDALRVQSWAIKASVLVDEGRYDEASMWADLVLQQHDSARVQAMVPTASRVAAQVALRRADWDDAARRFQIAADAAQRIGDTVELTQALVGLSDAAYYRGKLAESKAVLSRALDVCGRANDDVGLAYCAWNLAYVSMWQGDLNEAKQLLLRQQKLARRAGHRSMIANGKNALGDVERLRGRYDDAQGRYDEALQLFVAIGSGKRRTVRINLGLNALARGYVDKARVCTEEVLPELEKTNDKVLISLAHGILAACAARDENWLMHDAHVKAFINRVHDARLVDGEHAVLSEIVGDHARAKGEDERAAVLYDHALAIWSALDRLDRARVVELAMGKLGTVPRFRRPTKTPL